MDAVKKEVWIRRDEKIVSLEIYNRGKRVFYSYTYLFRGRRGEWRPAVRWDNHEEPHVDKYDENRSLVESQPCGEKNLDEVVKLASIFRKHLLAMDLSGL